MAHEKTALITGGSRGLGLATVKALCKAGMRTLFTSRNPHDGQQILQELSAYAGLLVYHPLEVSDNNSVLELGEYLEKNFGRLDVLINNAGVNYDTWQRVSDISIAEVEYTVSVNLLGPWRMCNICIPLMREAGEGRIINITSGAGSLNSQDGSTPAYSLSKNGLNTLTIALAADLQSSGISVYAVDPGWVRTDMGGTQAPLSAEQGADTVVWLATTEKRQQSGCLYRHRKLIPW